MARIPWRGNQSYEGKNRTRDWINRSGWLRSYEGRDSPNSLNCPAGMPYLCSTKTPSSNFSTNVTGGRKEQFARDRMKRTTRLRIAESYQDVESCGIIGEITIRQPQGLILTCSTASSASSVRQRCERFQHTIARVKQSIMLTRFRSETARLSSGGFNLLDRIVDVRDKLLFFSGGDIALLIPIGY